MSIESVMPSNHLILCRPLLLLPSIFPSIRVFSNESTLHIRWPDYWSFRFSITPSNECSGLIPIKTDWFDLLAVQGTLKNLCQHHSWKASIFWCWAFFMVHCFKWWGQNDGGKSMQNPFIDEVFIVPERYIIKEIKWPYFIVFVVVRKISRVMG